MDTTYKVNKKNLHHTCVMVVDENGHIQIIANGLILSESKESSRELLEQFIQENSISVLETVYLNR